jgi:hypothetical protein
MFDVGCDLLRTAGLALAARGFEAMGENLLRIGIELVEGEAGPISTGPCSCLTSLALVTRGFERMGENLPRIGMGRGGRRRRPA